jgi:glycosyltransferase involved in cell wall biosynthesis
LVEKKGYPYLIDACRLLIDRGYDVRLRIVGGGEMKDALRRHIAEVGLQERVELLGARPQDEVIELYRAATVFALPCIVLENGDRDGIPNVLVEAMRLGLPVVSTSVSGIPELVVDEETGLLVPPRDAEALASALARLLDDAALRARLAAGAAHHVASEFDLAANAATLKALLVEANA